MMTVMRQAANKNLRVKVLARMASHIDDLEMPEVEQKKQSLISKKLKAKDELRKSKM
jgi:hypothetical protein